jgi:hypothetical protein
MIRDGRMGHQNSIPIIVGGCFTDSSSGFASSKRPISFESQERMKDLAHRRRYRCATAWEEYREPADHAAGAHE